MPGDADAVLLVELALEAVQRGKLRGQRVVADCAGSTIVREHAASSRAVLEHGGDDDAASLAVARAPVQGDRPRARRAAPLEQLRRATRCGSSDVEVVDGERDATSDASVIAPSSEAATSRKQRVHRRRHVDAHRDERDEEDELRQRPRGTL